VLVKGSCCEAVDAVVRWEGMGVLVVVKSNDEFEVKSKSGKVSLRSNVESGFKSLYIGLCVLDLFRTFHELVATMDLSPAAVLR
jgi:hypothetical protein